MTMKRLALTLGVLASLSATAATTTIADDVQIAAGETLEIAVASGDTATYSGVISGEGGIKKTGAGTLVLSGANTFSGGFNLAAGKVRADHVTAFGTAPVTNTATAVGSQIIFNVADGVFENDFVLKGSKSGGNTSNPSVLFNKNTVVNGDITLSVETTVQNLKSAAPKVEINGQIKGGKALIYNIYGNTHFKSKIAVSSLYSGQDDSANGRLHLYSSENTISTILLRKGNVTCHSENVLGNASISMRFNLSGTDSTFVDLNGFDQRIKNITAYGEYSRPGLSTAGAKIKSSEPAVLTITGMAAKSTYTSYYGIDGPVSVVLDVPTTSGQRFANRTSATTGSLEVKSGTFEMYGTATFKNVPSVTVQEDGVFLVNSTAEGALTALETLTLNGKFSIDAATPNPFGSNLNIDLGDNAEFNLPEGMTLYVKSFSTNGVLLTRHMQINSGDIPQIKSGTIIITSVTSENTWVGGGSSDSISLPQNWENPDDIDLTGSMNATFAASDANGFAALVDKDAAFRHMVLSSADGFEFTGEKRVSVLTGLVASVQSEATPVYSFKSPLQLGSPQFITEGHFPLSVAAGATLRLEGGTESPVNIKKTGSGVLDISGSNVWNGAFIVADGNVKISGTITTPDGVDENTSVSRNGAGVLSFNMSTDRGASASRTLSVSNAVIEKPIWFAMGESASTSYFNFPAGTTNIFRGYFCNDDQANQRFRLIGRDTVVALEGGGYFPWNFQFTGLGTTYIRNKPIIHSGGSNGFVVQGNENGTPTAVFEVAGNSLKHLGTRGEGGTIDMRVDNVVNSSCTLTMSGAQERTRQGSILLLNGTSQTVGTLNANASVNAYSRIEGNGATLSIVNNSASSSSYCRFKFVGDVSLTFDSPGTLLLTNAVSSSSGSISVRRGTVTFAHDAAWTNASKVAVSGTGSIVINANNGFRPRPAFGRRVTLDFADEGKLKVPDGATMRVKYLYIGGVRMPSGFYGYSCSSDENIRKHFAESTGVIHAASGDGLTVTIR